MKLSVSLSDADVALIDALAASGGFSSRSAVIQHALSRLRAHDLHAAYAQAWDEWDGEGDAGLWDAASADGVPAVPADGATP